MCNILVTLARLMLKRLTPQFPNFRFYGSNNANNFNLARVEAFILGTSRTEQAQISELSKEMKYVSKEIMALKNQILHNQVSINEDSKEVNFVARKPYNRKSWKQNTNKNKSRQQSQCSYCHKLGHWKSNCRKLQAANKGMKSGKSNKQYKVNMVTVKRNFTSTQKVQPSQSSSLNWIVDSQHLQ